MGNRQTTAGHHFVKPRLFPRSLGTSLTRMPKLNQKADYGGSGVPQVDAERGLSEAKTLVERLMTSCRADVELDRPFGAAVDELVDVGVAALSICADRSLPR